MGLRFVVGFASQLVLARLLLPEHFGEFTRVLIAVGLIGLIRTFHTGEYLIQHGDDEAAVERAVDVLFTFELLCGVVVAGLGLMLSGPLLRLTGGAGLEKAVWLLLTSFLILPFGLVGSLLERRLAFMRVNLPAIIGTLAGPAIKIGLALAGWGMWSLLIGELARIALEMIVLWQIAPRRPRLALDRAIVLKAVRFGAPITGAAALAYYYWQIDDVVVSRMFGATVLGYYWLAFRIPRYLFQLREQLARVSYPVLVRLDTHGQIGPGLESMMRYAAYIAGLPLMLTLVFGEELIRLLFGPRWLPALLTLQILMAATATRVVLGLLGDVLKTRGKTGWFLVFNGMNAVTLSILVYPLTRDHGIEGTAVAVLLTLIPSGITGVVVVKRMVELHLVRALWAPLGATIALTAAGIALALPPAQGLGSLTLHLSCSMLAFGLLALLLDRRLPGELRWLRRALRAPAEPPPEDPAQHD